MEINILQIALTSALFSLAVAVITWLLSKRFKKTVYNDTDRKVTLESIRASIEKQMYTLNDRLIQNEERWRDVNHLLLAKNQLDNESSLDHLERVPYTQFLKANGISQNDLLSDSRLIFVLTPFHEDFDKDFLAIREACQNAGFKCIRGDETNFKSDIFPEILKLMVRARLIIANVNGRNANVMYELGLAQAMDKQVILVSKQPNFLPTDIKSKKFFIYEDYEQLKLMIRDALLMVEHRKEHLR